MSHSLTANSTISSIPSSLQSITPTQSPTHRKLSGQASHPLTNVDNNGSAPQLAGNGKKKYDANHALLIPTDRSREELESKWLRRLGRFEIWGEEVMSGYSLYSMRKW